MEITTQDLAVVILISGPGRDNMVEDAGLRFVGERSVNVASMDQL